MADKKTLKFSFNNLVDVHDIGLTEIEIVPCSVNTANERLFEIEAEIEGLHSKYDKLVNHASKLDYAVSVASGFLASLIDLFFVKTFDFKAGKEWSNEQVQEFVMHTAKKTGYKGNDPKGAIRYLEKFGAPSDSVANEFGGGLQHHLRDFAHHASPSGLLFSMLTQFTGLAYGTDEFGLFKTVVIENKEFIGNTLPQKVSLGLIHWMLHLASDMAGSSSARGLGTGIPGPVISLAKLISSLPIFKDKDNVNKLSITISKLFNGTLLGDRDENGKLIYANAMDLRGELAVLQQLTKQTIPIIINDALVRGFYSISRLIDEIKTKKKFNSIDWKRILPIEKDNGTLTRMLTISSGVFTALDQVDALIEGAINSKGSWAEFGRQVAMRVNFVGLGRFTISLASETILIYKKSKRKKEEMKLILESLYLNEAKMYYGDILYWKAIRDLEKSIEDLYLAFNHKTKDIFNDLVTINDKIDEVKNIDYESIKEYNPGLLDEIFNESK